MFRDDAENLCRLDDVLRLAADHDLLAHERELHRAVGKRFLDFPFQHLEGLLEGLHLGLQTLPFFQHVERRAFRIGQDHDHVAQGPVLLLGSLGSRGSGNQRLRTVLPGFLPTTANSWSVTI